MKLRAPSPWLYLLAWAMALLLFRAVAAVHAPREWQLERVWSSPWDDHDLYDCSVTRTINRIRP